MVECKFGCWGSYFVAVLKKLCFSADSGLSCHSSVNLSMYALGTDSD